MKYIFVAEFERVQFSQSRETLIALSICVFDTLLLFLWPRFQDAVIQYSMGTSDDLLRSIFSTYTIPYTISNSKKQNKCWREWYSTSFLTSYPLKPYQDTIKFIYSEKATKFCKISIVLWSYVVPVKSKVDISQNFVAFSEYMNFTT